jgi:hypothetical protein
MVEIELPDLESDTKALKKSPELLDWAVVHAINDVAASGKAAGTEVIFTRYYFESQGPVQRGIKVQKTSSSRVPAMIRFQGTRFPLKQFLPSATAEGINFMEIRGQSSSLIQAFGAVMKYGFGIFKRQPDASRYPVRSITGLSIANMAREDTEIMPEMTKHINEQLAKRLKFWVGEAKLGHKEKYERRTT